MDKKGLFGTREFHGNYAGISQEKKSRNKPLVPSMGSMKQKDRVAQEQRMTEGPVHTRNGINDMTARQLR